MPADLVAHDRADFCRHRPDVFQKLLRRLFLELGKLRQRTIRAVDVALVVFQVVQFERA
ncbi:MAG: hypothetical protein BWX86_01383 [Verrucomicrobia bacterium ADurb.Bin122]|nr:MAG: hypothetical protein BWX86_01383 [Verrucomicrobia bacterium ADurb.Bin122]